MKEISWPEFEQIELCTGTIIEVHDFPETRKPAWKLLIDFGDKIGTKKSSAQTTDLYSREELMGKQIGPFISECLVTGFTKKNGSVVLAIPDKASTNGLKLS